MKKRSKKTNESQIMKRKVRNTAEWGELRQGIPHPSQEAKRYLIEEESKDE